MFKGKRRSDVEVRVIGAVTFQVDFSVLDFCLQVCWPVDKLVKLVIEPFFYLRKSLITSIFIQLKIEKITYFFVIYYQVPLGYVVGSVLTCPPGKIMLKVSPRD